MAEITIHAEILKHRDASCNNVFIQLVLELTCNLDLFLTTGPVLHIMAVLALGYDHGFVFTVCPDLSQTLLHQMPYCLTRQ